MIRDLEMRNRDFDMIFCFFFSVRQVWPFYICCCFFKISFQLIVLLSFHKGNFCKKSSPSVDSSWFIAIRLWNRGLISVGLCKPNSVPRQTAKRQQYQRLADLPISVFEIYMAQINKIGPVSNFSRGLLYFIALRMCTGIPSSFYFNKL